MEMSSVVKSNELIQASYTLTLVEQRMILLAIVEARETGHGIDANTHLTVGAGSYANQFNVTLDAAYLALESAVKTLFERQVTINDIEPLSGKPRKRVTRWVSEIAYVPDNGKIQLIFSPAIVPEITRLEANFTSYDLEQVSGLQSAYAVRLYELLIKWRSVGRTPAIGLNEFRGQLGVGSGEYQRMEVFKRRVLDLALDQINEKTDIIASYEQHKNGRNISGFSFKFKQKSRKLPAKQASQRDANTPDFFTQLTDKQIDLLVRSDLFLADFYELYGASDDYATARVKLRKKLVEQPEQFGSIDFERYK